MTPNRSIPNPHPITLAAAFEPGPDPTQAIGYAVCVRCGTRWSGPYLADDGDPIRTAEITESVVARLNANAQAFNPKPVRAPGQGLCCTRSGIPVAAPAMDRLKVAEDPRPRGPWSRRPGIERAENVVTAAVILPWAFLYAARAAWRALSHWETWAGLVVLWFVGVVLAAKMPAGTAGALVGVLLPAAMVLALAALVTGWALGWWGILGRRRPKDHGSDPGGSSMIGTYEPARTVRPAAGWEDRHDHNPHTEARH